MTATTKVNRGGRPFVPRLPAGPLLVAVDAARSVQGVGLRWVLTRWELREYRRAKAEGSLTVGMARRLCASLDRNPRDVYGDAWPEPCDQDDQERPKPQRLSAEPLVGVIEARLRRIIEGLMPLTDERPAHAEAVRQVFGDDAALLRTYQRARARGWVLLETAERLCDTFGWHPRELWGDRYDEAVFAGCEENYDPWGETAA